MRYLRNVKEKMWIFIVLFYHCHMKNCSGTCNKGNTSLLVRIPSQGAGFPTSANNHLDLRLHQETMQNFLENKWKKKIHSPSRPIPYTLAIHKSIAISHMKINPLLLQKNNYKYQEIYRKHFPTKWKLYSNAIREDTEREYRDHIFL